MGVDYSEQNVYTIDIQNSSGLPSNLYANDLENKLIGATNAMEWKYNESDEWNRYSEKEPDLTGDKSIIVRMGATGVHLADTSTKTYNFTQDNQPDTQKYISIDRLSIYDVSSEEPGHSAPAQNAIDGNINTLWHSNWNGQDKDRYIVIKLSEPTNISALEYVPRQSGSNGRIKNGKILVSMDGEEWIEVYNIDNWANSAASKVAKFDESVKAQYVKLVATENYGDGRSFITAAMINLYEDITKAETPTAEIKYDIEKLTNSDVTVTLVNPSTEITITNNNGKDTYVFTENGEFTFEFEDKYGNKGTATAIVDWIDKIIPTATISYDIEEETNQPVRATISDFSEKVTITNNDGKDTYTFKENGSFTFEFVDEAGNIGTATASVTWIKEDTETPGTGDDENPGEDDEQKPDDNPGEEDEQNPAEKPGEDDEQNPDNKLSEDNEQELDEILNFDNGESNKKPENGQRDNTLATGKIPQTGFNSIIVLIISVLIVLSAFIYIRIKKLGKK